MNQPGIVLIQESDNFSLGAASATVLSLGHTGGEGEGAEVTKVFAESGRSASYFFSSLEKGKDGF
jgi:hypothetical protein